MYSPWWYVGRYGFLFSSVVFGRLYCPRGLMDIDLGAGTKVVCLTDQYNFQRGNAPIFIIRSLFCDASIHVSYPVVAPFYLVRHRPLPLCGMMAPKRCSIHVDQTRTWLGFASIQRLRMDQWINATVRVFRTRKQQQTYLPAGPAIVFPYPSIHPVIPGEKVLPVCLA